MIGKDPRDKIHVAIGFIKEEIEKIEKEVTKCEHNYNTNGIGTDEFHNCLFILMNHQKALVELTKILGYTGE